MLEHVTSEFALAVERDVTDLANMRLLLRARRMLAGSCSRHFVFVLFPEVQRRIVQIIEIVIYGFALLLSSDAIFGTLIVIILIFLFFL